MLQGHDHSYSRSNLIRIGEKANPKAAPDVRDLRIYAQPLGQDDLDLAESGGRKEVDAIVETPNTWAAFEAKLTGNERVTDEAAQRLIGIAAEIDVQRHCAQLELPEQADGYLEIPGGSKGYVWFNDLRLGRYWNRGPQQRLYVPWPATRTGRNVVTVLELDALTDLDVFLGCTPDLG